MSSDGTCCHCVCKRALGSVSLVGRRRRAPTSLFSVNMVLAIFIYSGVYLFPWRDPQSSSNQCHQRWHQAKWPMDQRSAALLESKVKPSVVISTSPLIVTCIWECQALMCSGIRYVSSHLLRYLHQHCVRDVFEYCSPCIAVLGDILGVMPAAFD